MCRQAIKLISHLFDSFIQASGATDRLWRLSVLFGASWPLLFFIVFFGISYLFAPTSRFVVIIAHAYLNSFLNSNQTLTMVQLPDDDAEMQSRSAPAAEHASMGSPQQGLLLLLLAMACFVCLSFCH